jgi:pimeloyl-ACP methyl ester carboxylesterase
MPNSRSVCWTLVAVALVATAAACSDDDVEPDGAPSQSSASKSTPVSMDASAGDVDGFVSIGGRDLYVRCTGTGSPTLMLEGGDEDTSDSYSFAEADLAEVTRTCVYDRANLGRSDPDPGPRGLAELVADFDGVLKSANIPGPYVLVGTSGGGYISAGYAVKHPRQVAGIVFVEVPAPFRNPPAPIVADTRWDSPVNIEKRDYLQVEKDAWAARTRIGGIPVTVMSNKYSADELAAAEYPSERQGMRTNVSDQRGWLVLSPSAKQVVVHTGHAIEESDPHVVLDAILDVVAAARS